MGTTVCPKCNSSRLKRSHSRGFKERFIKITGRRAYRCIHCGWRGILERDDRSKRTYLKSYSMGQILLIIAVLVVSLSALLYWLTKEPEKTEIKEIPGFILPYYVPKKTFKKMIGKSLELKRRGNLTY